MNSSRAARKQQLIEQAAAHRMQLRQSGQAVQAGVQPATLIKGAAGSALLTALAVLKNRQRTTAVSPETSSRLGRAALLPIALRGVAWLAKATARKPAVRKIVIAGIAGVAVAVIARQAMRRASARRK